MNQPQPDKAVRLFDAEGAPVLDTHFGRQGIDPRKEFMVQKADVETQEGREKVTRNLLAFAVNNARSLGDAYNALVNGRATLGPRDRQTGLREIMFEGQGTGYRLTEEAAKRFGIFDWGRDAADDMF